MPTHKVHKLVNKLVLKKEHEDVNLLLDYPYKWLKGGHRVLFHDEKTTPLAVYLITKDKDKALAAYLHIMLDKKWKRS
jgi:hypothetical protein